MRFNKKIFFLLVCCFMAVNGYAVDKKQIGLIVGKQVLPIIKKYNIPGMAIAVSIKGENYFFNYGVTSKRVGTVVTELTVFEIGSVTKLLTGLLAAYAGVENKLSLENSVNKYFPQLTGSIFNNIRMLNLATHTSGLQLFVPDNIRTENQLISFLRRWQPPYTVGSHRVYSNIGIGLLGLSAAKSLDGGFMPLVENKLLRPIGLTQTYFRVPAKRQKDYAQGYTVEDKPIRVKIGVVAPEAYGLKSCSADLIRFVNANMQEIKIEKKLQRAILSTQIGYFKTNNMIQDLVWEQYAWPTSLEKVLAGNGDLLKHKAVKKVTPPLPPQKNVFINKTGSTNGFSAYVAFIPQKKLGFVLLANKRFPTSERVKMGYAVLSALG